jgi:hypothetical protein
MDMKGEPLHMQLLLWCCSSIRRMRMMSDAVCIMDDVASDSDSVLFFFVFVPLL